MVRKILSPTDLSHNSKAGVAYALSLAHENHAEMILLYIMAIPFHQFEAFREVDFFTPREIPQLTISYYLRVAKMQLGHFLTGTLPMPSKAFNVV